MRTYSTLLFSFSLFLLIHAQGLAQSKEQQLIGNWKHADVVNRLGAHVTIDLKPFDLYLFKDHHFEMTSEGMTATGTWSLKKETVLLNIAPTVTREGRVQKLYIDKLTKESLVVEVKDFEITDGLLIVMHRME